jgi:tripartite-type tricarboxylate transporter receptor subunit TctC
MKLARRKFLQLAAGAAAVPAMPRIALAQTYPTRPITMIVPFAAGGAGDTVARIISEGMRGRLGQSVVIENVTGADGTIGTGRATRARPDGYTICFGSMDTHVLNAAFYSLPYDVLNDFVPISPLVTGPAALFSKRSLPAKNLAELIEWLKANRNKASAGITQGGYRLITLFLQKETGTRFILVPYRGGAPAVQNLAAGQIDLLIASRILMPQARAGNIKVYAVTSETRSRLAPGVPTFAELGLPTLTWSNWAAFFAPRGTPKDIIAKLNAAVVEALADPAVQSRLAEIDDEIFPRERQTPEALGALQKADAEKWWPVIREFGIKAE